MELYHNQNLLNSPPIKTNSSNEEVIFTSEIDGKNYPANGEVVFTVKITGKNNFPPFGGVSLPVSVHHSLVKSISTRKVSFYWKNLYRRLKKRR